MSTAAIDLPGTHTDRLERPPRVVKRHYACQYPVGWYTVHTLPREAVARARAADLALNEAIADEARQVSVISLGGREVGSTVPTPDGLVASHCWWCGDLEATFAGRPDAVDAVINHDLEVH